MEVYVENYPMSSSIYIILKNTCIKILEQCIYLFTVTLLVGSGVQKEMEPGQFFISFIFEFFNLMYTFTYSFWGSKTKCGLFMHTSQLLLCLIYIVYKVIDLRLAGLSGLWDLHGLHASAGLTLLPGSPQQVPNC